MRKQLLAGDQTTLDEECSHEEEARRRARGVSGEALELVAEHLRQRLLLRVSSVLAVRRGAEHKEPEQLEEEGERLQLLLEHIDDQVDHSVSIEIEASYKSRAFASNALL